MPASLSCEYSTLTGGHIGDPARFPGALLGGLDGRAEQTFFAPSSTTETVRLRYSPLVSAAGSSGQVFNEHDRLLRALCSVIAFTASFSLAQRAMLCRSANTSH